MNPGVYLVVTALLYMFATALQMVTNASRLAGVRTQRLATGLTLFNLFADRPRLLKLFYVPLIGRARRHTRSRARRERATSTTSASSWSARRSARCSAARSSRGRRGCSQRGIAVVRVARDCSSPSIAAVRAAGPFAGAARASGCRGFSMLRFSPAHLPKPFLLWNIIVMGFWVAGPLAAYLRRRHGT